MRPTFSPTSTQELNQAITLLERVYHREMCQDAPYHMGKLSSAIGELMFLAQSTSTRPEAKLPEEYVRIIELEGVMR